MVHSHPYVLCVPSAIYLKVYFMSFLKILRIKPGKSYSSTLISTQLAYKIKFCFRKSEDSPFILTLSTFKISEADSPLTYKRTNNSRLRRFIAWKCWCLKPWSLLGTTSLEYEIAAMEPAGDHLTLIFYA